MAVLRLSVDTGGETYAARAEPVSVNSDLLLERFIDNSRPSEVR